MSKQKTYGIGSRVSFIRGRQVRTRVVGKVVDIKHGARGQYAVVALKGGELVNVRPSQLEGPRAGI